MCRSCLAEGEIGGRMLSFFVDFVVRPDRETFTSEDGHYMLNYKGCASCGKRGQLTALDK